MDRDALAGVWPILSDEERVEGFALLSEAPQSDFFATLPAAEQACLLLALPHGDAQRCMRGVPLDDAADVVQAAPPGRGAQLLALLPAEDREDVVVLLGYPGNVAAGLMDPRFASVRPGWTADEALARIREAAAGRRRAPPYLYVTDGEGGLLGAVSLRELIGAPAGTRMDAFMTSPLVTLSEWTAQEQVARVFARHGLAALPVVDAAGRIAGVVTADDVMDVMEEEATEDIQKIGGSGSLDAPYLRTTLPTLVRKRGGWLCVLFLGEMLTATAMGAFEHQLQRAVVLALFIPLIISSGGNSGSQASTLVIRALALGEVRVRDWWRVVRRELVVGAALGLALGTLGLLRIALWQFAGGVYGPHWLALGLTLAATLVGVVLFGSVAGAILPLVLRRAGMDPASASAPLVATLVDVTGLVIYFGVASVLLRGILL